jgi:hypothetical protein
MSEPTSVTVVGGTKLNHVRTSALSPGFRGIVTQFMNRYTVDFVFSAHSQSLILATLLRLPGS